MEQLSCNEVAYAAGRSRYKNFFHLLFSRPKLKIVDITNDSGGIIVHAAHEGNLRIHNASVSVVRINLSDIDDYIGEFTTQHQSLLIFLSFIWKRKDERKERVIEGTVMRMIFYNKEIVEFDLKEFTDELSLYITTRKIADLIKNIF